MSVLCCACLTHFRTPAERAVWSTLRGWQAFGSREASFLSLKLTLGPYLSLDVEDTWEALAIKMKWLDLHRQLCALPSESTAIAISPELVSQVNVQDGYGLTPLFYAAHLSPEAVNELLLAGANPRLNRILFEVVRTGEETLVSTVVRAGADVVLWDEQEEAGTLRFCPYIPRASIATTTLELARHTGHLFKWDLRETYKTAVVEWANAWISENSPDEDMKDRLDFYSYCRAHLDNAQYLPTDDFVDDCLGIGLPSTSLIRAGLEGEISAIGDLIRRGAMVNERDPEDRTLLHLIAIGEVPNGYRIALELVRHGGWGVHWDALICDEDGDWTALQIAESRLHRHDLKLSESRQGGGVGPEEDRVVELSDGDVEEIDLDDEEVEDIATDEEYEELKKIRDLLAARRLPPGEKYLWPCMDPDFYKSETTMSEVRIPGGWDYFEGP